MKIIEVHPVKDLLKIENADCIIPTYDKEYNVGYRDGTMGVLIMRTHFKRYIEMVKNEDN